MYNQFAEPSVPYEQDRWTVCTIWTRLQNHLYPMNKIAEHSVPYTQDHWTICSLWTSSPHPALNVTYLAVCVVSKFLYLCLVPFNQLWWHLFFTWTSCGGTYSSLEPAAMALIRHLNQMWWHFYVTWTSFDNSCANPELIFSGHPYSDPIKNRIRVRIFSPHPDL